MKAKHPFKLALLHIFCFLAVIFLCPFRYLAEFFRPLFGEKYKKWIRLNIPGIGDYIKFLNY